jgi:lysophospholipase L1-like esterase
MYLRIGNTATTGTTTLAHLRVTAHVSGSISATPTSIPSSHSGNISLTLTGTGTSWAGGGGQFTVSGVTGAAKVSENVTSTTAATLVVHTGSGTGTLTVSDGTFSTTVTVGAPSFTISPTSGAINSSQSITATGTNTVWTQETASTLFTKLGGTGASISSISVSSDTTATFTLANGSATGTITITDTPTSDTASFTVTPVKNVIAFLGDSLTFGTDATGYDGTTSHSDTSPITTGTSQTYPAQVMQALGTTLWNGYNAGHSGHTSSQLAADYTSSIKNTGLYSSNAAINVLVILIGTNDLGGDTTGTIGPTILSNVQGVVTTALSDGWKVIVAACPPYQGTYQSQREISRAYYNNAMGSNWRSYGLSAFAAAPSASGGDVRIGPLAAATNATYYTQSDVPHMINAGYGVVAASVAQAVFQVQNAGGTGGSVAGYSRSRAVGGA